MAVALQSPLFRNRIIPDNKKKENKRKARRNIDLNDD